MSERATHRTFGAVIGHADDADLLRRCIAHHLAIGVQWIFVSLNLQDSESATVVKEFSTERVLSGEVQSYAEDAFDFFTAALAAMTKWVNPDWVLFLDTDEFWLPATGRIGDTQELEAVDVFVVPRFNVPPILTQDGTPRAFPEKMTLSLPVIVPATSRAAPESWGPETWLRWPLRSKVLVRPSVVSQVTAGAHSIVAKGDNVRTAIPADILVLHFPFTTTGRFYRKISAIREFISKFGRDRIGQASHWMRWAGLGPSALADEFRQQFLRADDLERLRESGEITSPREIFARALQP